LDRKDCLDTTHMTRFRLPGVSVSPTTVEVNKLRLVAVRLPMEFTGVLPVALSGVRPRELVGVKPAVPMVVTPALVTTPVVEPGEEVVFPIVPVRLPPVAVPGVDTMGVAPAEVLRWRAPGEVMCNKLRIMGLPFGK